MVHRTKKTKNNKIKTGMSSGVGEVMRAEQGGIKSWRSGGCCFFQLPRYSRGEDWEM